MNTAIKSTLRLYIGIEEESIKLISKIYYILAL